MPAAQSRIDRHPIADGEPRDTRTKLGDDAGTIAAQDVGQFELQSWPSSQDPQIKLVEGRRFDLYKHLARTDLRFRYLRNLDLLERSVLVEEYRFHASTLWLSLDDRLDAAKSRLESLLLIPNFVKIVLVIIERIGICKDAFVTGGF